MGLAPKNMKRGYLEPLVYLHVRHDVTPHEGQSHRLTKAHPDAVTAFLENHRAELQALHDVFAVENP